MNQQPDVQAILGLRRPPVAVAFLDAPPEGIERWSGAHQPAGCAFWRWAQQGKSFYTLPEDHFGCAVGSYTHSFDLPPPQASKLEDTVGAMVESGYLQRWEVPAIPRLEKASGVVVYGLAERGDFEPDIVLLVANPRQAMLVYEACLKAGAGDAVSNLMGRPSCAVLPLTLKGGRAALSLGCAGNRLYAELADDELYVAIPGDRWTSFKFCLQEVARANQRMQAFYEGNRGSRGLAP